MTTPNFEELDPDSPEFEAAVAVPADQAEIEALGGDAGATDDAPAAEDDDTTADPPSAAAAADEATPPAADPPPAAPEKVAGVASKDGKHVLPFAALKGARDEAKAERLAREAAERKAAALEQQIADLKAGKTPPADEIDDLSDEALDELVTDFPRYKGAVERIKALRETASQSAAAPAEPALPANDPVQDAIDAVPTLSAWQYSDHDKFQRAVEHDKVLQTSPKWRDKPLEVRFAEATRRAAEEFDVPFEGHASPQDNPPTPTQGKRNADPTPTRRQVQTLSDFKGGAASKQDDIRGLPAVAGVDAFAKMSDAEIDAYLRRVEG